MSTKEVRSFCAECGPDVRVDEEGLCLSCGATALGEWATRAPHKLRPRKPALARRKAKR